MSPQFDENAGWDTGAIVVANDANGTALGTFVTAVGSPAIEVIPAGIWEVNFYAQSSDGVNSTAVRVKVATLAGATQTVIATSDWVYLSDPSAVVGYSASVYVPTTDVALTDRVEIIFEGRRFVSPTQTITLHFGTDSITHAHTTINAPGGTGLVKVVNGYLQSPASLLVNADVDDAAAIAVAKLAAGTNDYVLTTVAGVPAWNALPSSGVSSLTGTADQVLVGGTSGSPQTGVLTLTLPQSIASTNSPTFAGLTLGSLSGLLRATAGVLAGSATVALGSEVTGTLSVANGGTGLTSAGASGNLLVSNGSGLASVAMSNDATLASTGALTLKNTGTAGTYGSASVVPVIVTDPQGRVTGVTSTSIVVSITGNTSGTLSVGRGGTGATTLTGYVKGAGTANMTASPTIPVADVTGAAPLASPTFTGTPAAPTAVVDTNTTQIATTAYVVGQGYLKSATASTTYAPLASPTFTGTVTIPAGASISGFAPLASPTFTGTPSLPTGTTGVTQSAGNNTTALSTTAFVTAAVAAASGAPYDVSGEAAGTLANGDEIWHFKATRAFTLSATAANHLAGAVTAPSGTCVITVYKNTTSTQVFTITYTASSTGVIGSVTNNTVAQGDLLFAKITSGPSTISNPYWTFFGTL